MESGFYLKNEKVDLLINSQGIVSVCTLMVVGFCFVLFFVFCFSGKALAEVFGT